MTTNDMHATRQTYTLPLSPDFERHAHLNIRDDLTPVEWQRLLDILDTFRDGLVRLPHPSTAHVASAGVAEGTGVA